MPRYQRLSFSDSFKLTTTSPAAATTNMISVSNTSDDDDDNNNDDDERLSWAGSFHNKASNRTITTTTTGGNCAVNAKNATLPSSSSEALSLFDELEQSRSNLVQVDLDEQITMEIPLLGGDKPNFHGNPNNNNNYHPDYPTFNLNTKQCHCEQPGFGANLVNKSTQDAKSKILLAISLCCIFMLIEFIGGYIAGSLAIMTDAAHLASDCISFVIGLVAIRMGSRPPDSKMSFGYKRMEVLGAIVSVLGIWILTATLVIVAIQRVITNDYDLDADAMMIISGIGIGMNIVMIFVLHGSALSGFASHAHGHSHGHGHTHLHHHTNHSSDLTSLDDSGSISGFGSLDSVAHSSTKKQSSTAHQNPEAFDDLIIKSNHSHNHSHNSAVSNDKNLNLRAAMIHVIGDLVQSIGVFLASVLIKFIPKAHIADPLCTLLFSVIVIMTTVHLFRESIGILLDVVPSDFKLHDLEYDFIHIDGVKSVHHINVWNHTSNHRVLMAHLVIDFAADSNQVLKEATKLASGPKYQIKHSTIQIERLAL